MIRKLMIFSLIFISPLTISAENNVVLYGHSFLSNREFSDYLSKSLDADVYNFARGGSNSQEAALVSGTVVGWFSVDGGQIPASGSVYLSQKNGDGTVPLWKGAFIYATVHGIPGILEADKNYGKLKFTRKYSGNPVKFNGYEKVFVIHEVRTTDNSEQRGAYFHKSSNDIYILWIGRNTKGGSISEIIKDYETIVKNIKTSRFVIMPEFPYSNEKKGGAAWDNIMKLNATLKSKYPDNYCEINGVDALKNFIDHYNKNYPADVSDVNSGITPESLRSDSLHPSSNKTEYNNVSGVSVNADFITKFVKLKGWTK